MLETSFAGELLTTIARLSRGIALKVSLPTDAGEACSDVSLTTGAPRLFLDIEFFSRPDDRKRIDNAMVELRERQLVIEAMGYPSPLFPNEETGLIAEEYRYTAADGTEWTIRYADGTGNDIGAITRKGYGIGYNDYTRMPRYHLTPKGWDVADRIRLNSEASEQLTPGPAIDDESRKVLLDLLRTKPVLRKTVDLEVSTGVSRRTVGIRLNELIELGLATRPKGKNAGATITSAGEGLAKGFPNSSQ